MEIIELKAEKRLETGKGGAKKLRLSGKVPASLYGRDFGATNLAVDAREFQAILRAQAGAHILRLTLEGEKQGPAVVVREIQRNPLRDEVLHVDFQKVALDEKIVAAVAVEIVGDSIGVREGGVVQYGLRELQIEALPTDLPGSIDIDISELNIGDSLHVSDASLPANLTPVTSLDELIVSIAVPTKVEEVEAAPEELEEGEEAVEGEEAPAEGEAPSEGSEGS